jgi:DNA-binding NarL/FixJ family response regulator
MCQSVQSMLYLLRYVRGYGEGSPCPCLPSNDAAAGSPRAERGSVSGTVLIVDDNAFVRHALRSCIEQSADWQVCAEAENGRVAVEKVTELHPDVVILDLQMPVMDGLQAAAQISRLAPDTAMLMVTMHNYEQLSKYARAFGIREVLSKSDRLADHLLASLNNIH